MKAPLSLLSACFGYLFFAGMFGIEVSEDLIAILGFGMVGGIIWSWVVALKE
jgi:hypothetical protein